MMTTVTDTENIAPEQAADLAALQAAAGEGDQLPEQGQEGQNPGPQAPNLGQEISGMLSAVIGVLGPALPSVAAIYTPEVIATASESIARVCEKHGWLSGGLMGRYGEEITCLMVCGPLAYATHQAAQADIAKLKKAKEGTNEKLQGANVESKAAPTEQPGAKTVIIGAPVAA